MKMVIFGMVILFFGTLVALVGMTSFLYVLFDGVLWTCNRWKAFIKKRKIRKR
jgi:uncharacterized membrane protein